MIIGELPNLFDQYSQHENRVTNALLQTLASSPRLFQSFLRVFLGIRVRLRKDRVVITAQKRPHGRGDRPEGVQAAGERDSIPDGWIVCDEGDWAVVIESKVQPQRLRQEQLRAHLRAISSFGRRFLLVLTPDEQPPRELARIRGNQVAVRWHSWRMIHEWISRNAIARPERNLTGSLLRHLKGFLEMDELLSGFQGIDFPEGYI